MYQYTLLLIKFNLLMQLIEYANIMEILEKSDFNLNFTQNFLNIT